LLHRIPLPKLKEYRLFKYLTKIKYAVLGIMVIGIPTYLNLFGGVPLPAFCQFICPAGTLEAGIPLVLLDSKLNSQVGLLFVWKAAVLIATVLAAITIFRPFCRFLCPLGAIYALFNKISIIGIRRDNRSCVGCGNCVSTCPMHAETAQSPECIRCGKCVKECSAKALRWGFKSAEGDFEASTGPRPI
jgi:ferredoxin